MSDKEFSIHFLCNFTDNVDNTGIHSTCVDLWSCNWLSVLQSSFVQDFIENAYKIPKNGFYSDDEILKSAIAFLLVFIQANFTGPELSIEYEKTSQKILEINSVDETTKADAEDLVDNVKNPEFLMCSKKMLSILIEKYPKSIVINWWMFRMLCINQNVQDEITPKIYNQIKNISEFLLVQNNFNTKELEILLNVEIAQAFLLVERPHKCRKILTDTCEKYGIELVVKGLMGYRTKFQQTPLPQLCLKVNRNNEDLMLPPATETNSQTLPKLIINDDEVRLEQIQFCNKEDNDVLTLPCVLQALIITELKCLLRSQPKDCLLSEELKPYIQTLLNQEAGPFSIRLTALFINIAQEATHKRTVERCLKQSEEIVEILSAHTCENSLHRFSYIFGSAMPPQWIFIKQLGDLMVSLGYVKTALDLYLKIKAWDDVIECYTRLNLRHKAADIILQELEKRTTTRLYCLMGDATSDPEYYEKAWKFSNGKSARAQKHWGNYYFAKKDYAEALPHLEESVELNPLQEVQWLRLGYAALELEKWELAVHAYLRYTHLEPHGFESWNNLAKALIRLGDKKRAHKILHESLKCNFNNWRIWDNFMAVSVDTGHFEDALNAYGRIIELREKDKFLDIEVLEIIIKEISANTMNVQGKPSSLLVRKVTAILDNQCIVHPNEWKLWELAADIANEPVQSALKLQKCLRAYMENEAHWMHQEDTVVECLNICLSLCKKCLEAINKLERDMDKDLHSLIASSRLSSQGCIRCIDKEFKSEEAQLIIDQLQECYIELTANLKKI